MEGGVAEKDAGISEQMNAEKKDRQDGNTPLQKWYSERQQQLTGKCIRCGETYNKLVEQFARAATAHVLPKRDNMFPSVALHPENFLELSATCGCHNWYDNQASWEEIALSPIWPIVLEKFRIIEPYIKERSRIPEVLLQEIKPII